MRNPAGPQPKTVDAAPMNQIAVPQVAGVPPQSGDDLAFVARMLGDAAAPDPTSAGRAHARRATRKSKKTAPSNFQEAHPSDHGEALVNRHNKPSNRSSDREYHCEACDCSVPARDRDWEVHTSGIKHQRQLVSLLHTGKLGSRVVSLFEAEPGILPQSCDPTTCLKATVLFTLCLFLLQFLMNSNLLNG